MTEPRAERLLNVTDADNNQVMCVLCTDAVHLAQTGNSSYVPPDPLLGPAGVKSWLF